MIHDLSPLNSLVDIFQHLKNFMNIYMFFFICPKNGIKLSIVLQLWYTLVHL